MTGTVPAEQSFRSLHACELIKGGFCFGHKPLLQLRYTSPRIAKQLGQGQAILAASFLR